MRRLVLALVLLLLAGFVSSAWLTRPVVHGTLDDGELQGLQLAPLDRALTLAMTRAGRVLLVTAVDAQGVQGIDLAAASGRAFTDAIQAWAVLGEVGLRSALTQAQPVSYPWAELGLPLAPSSPHIAAGTNYRAHAREVGVEEGQPFLFPKLSEPTPWDAPVLPGARLDYEAELCAVLLSEHSSATPAELGYVLCGDFTDRWVLVRDLQLDGVMGRTGFATGKGGDSRLPLGPLLVIPVVADVYRDIELRLYWNDELRQRDVAGSMVWSPREILDAALRDCEAPYIAGEQVLSISDCEVIPAGTLVLTGTPEGVLFKLGTLWNPLAYLREGDAVTSFGTYLGYTRNVVAR